MKEVTFIRQNIEKWKRAETMVEQAESLSPDELADAYTELTADLAFAQTHFPASRITIYLNNLASALHNRIYRNKREKWSRIITYWTREVPSAMHDARRELVASFIIFVVSALIGVVSAAGDPDFVRLILGNSYVDMTLNNIANGEPMAVYNGSSEFPMFLSITLNNIMVSFNCFAMGLLTSFGTGYMLLNNGIMIGAFQTFFYQHDLLWESFLAIWLHGTLEIWAIIVAGAAGLALGNGWLFPGTYSRLESFKRGAKKGLKIVVGTVPVFIMAGFIEGFVTRHTELSGISLPELLTEPVSEETNANVPEPITEDEPVRAYTPELLYIDRPLVFPVPIFIHKHERIISRTVVPELLNHQCIALLFVSMMLPELLRRYVWGTIRPKANADELFWGDFRRFHTKGNHRIRDGTKEANKPKLQPFQTNYYIYQ